MAFMFTLVQLLKKIYNFIHQYLASTMALAGYSCSMQVRGSKTVLEQKIIQENQQYSQRFLNHTNFLCISFCTRVF